MRYLISVIDDAPSSGTSDEMAAIDVFNENLVAKGHWVLAGGLETCQQSAEGERRKPSFIRHKHIFMSVLYVSQVRWRR